MECRCGIVENYSFNVEICNCHENGAHDQLEKNCATHQITGQSENSEKMSKVRCYSTLPQDFLLLDIIMKIDGINESIFHCNRSMFSTDVTQAH